MVSVSNVSSSSWTKDGAEFVRMYKAREAMALKPDSCTSLRGFRIHRTKEEISCDILVCGS
jgi:hypothetical protein